MLFDNDNDEGLLAVQEDAAEAMAGAVYDGPLACVRVSSRPHQPIVSVGMAITFLVWCSMAWREMEVRCAAE